MDDLLADGGYYAGRRSGKPGRPQARKLGVKAGPRKHPACAFRTGAPLKDVESEFETMLPNYEDSVQNLAIRGATRGTNLIDRRHRCAYDTFKVALH